MNNLFLVFVFDFLTIIFNMLLGLDIIYMQYNILKIQKVKSKKSDDFPLLMHQVPGSPPWGLLTLSQWNPCI